MQEKKPELSAAMESELEPKVFKKNPLLRTKFMSSVYSDNSKFGKFLFVSNPTLVLRRIGYKFEILDAEI
tara:strand:- start:128 stop:337 length:210 start_codon:yes stop_codon:yes gene_type:complete